MIVVGDVETNGLENPTKIHCGVFINIETEEEFIFEALESTGKEQFITFAQSVTHWVGHNFAQFDASVINTLVAPNTVDISHVTDTLVVSRTLNQGIEGGHSLEAWGQRLKFPKTGLDITDWSVYTKEMLSRCIQDARLNYKLYRHLYKYITSNIFSSALDTEHKINILCLSLQKSGFPFKVEEAKKLHDELSIRLTSLDNELKTAFPPKARLVREITPRATQHGTLNRSDFRWLSDNDLTSYSPGASFGLIEFEEFNPGSPKQIVERLNEAGWKPTEKTKGHLAAIKSNSWQNRKHSEEIPSEARLAYFERYGWTISEDNLRTLPDTAPESARRLVERLLIASRVSDLVEWINLTQADGRIHGRFNHIGAWTGRMSHDHPNMANTPIPQHKDDPNRLDILSDDINSRMRSYWYAPNGYRLIGTDADGIQMRIFAHYVNDSRLIKALVEGSKKDGTDIHSLHAKALGEACKGRNPAKTFIYAWLLGAGLAKVASILECSLSEARESIGRFLGFYPSLLELKRTQIPRDASRGYFTGLDNRRVMCDNTHKMLGGYLQNGEAVIMKRAAIQWTEQLTREKIPYEFINFVHDEWQTLVPDEDGLAEYVAKIQQKSIVDQGSQLNLNCPLGANSKFGYNWNETH